MNKFDRAFEELIKTGEIKMAGLNENGEVMYELDIPDPDLTVKYELETKIFLLTPKNSFQTQAMKDARGKVLTFAFTTLEKAKTFLRMAQAVSQMKNVDAVFPTTIKEFEELRNKGKVIGDLAIDTNPATTFHSDFVGRKENLEKENNETDF